MRRIDADYSLRGWPMLAGGGGAQIIYSGVGCLSIRGSAASRRRQAGAVSPHNLLPWVMSRTTVVIMCRRVSDIVRCMTMDGDAVRIRPDLAHDHGLLSTLGWLIALTCWFLPCGGRMCALNPGIAWACVPVPADGRDGVGLQGCGAF